MVFDIVLDSLLFNKMSKINLLFKWFISNNNDVFSYKILSYNESIQIIKANEIFSTNKNKYHLKSKFRR